MKPAQSNRQALQQFNRWNNAHTKPQERPDELQNFKATLIFCRYCTINQLESYIARLEQLVPWPLFDVLNNYQQSRWFHLQAARRIKNERFGPL